MARRRPSSGRCKSCGAIIFWANKPGGGWHRPLVQRIIEDLIVIDDDGVARTTTSTEFFQVHVCNPEDVAQREKEREAFVPGTGHLKVEIAVACPRCGAEVGERCRPLRPERYAYGEHLVTAHPARQEAAGTKRG